MAAKSWFSPLFVLLFGRGLRRSYASANVRLKSLAEQRLPRQSEPAPRVQAANTGHLNP